MCADSASVIHLQSKRLFAQLSMSATKNNAPNTINTPKTYGDDTNITNPPKNGYHNDSIRR